MTALLRPDETLTLGVNVIIRPGDILGPVSYTHGAFVAPQDWVALTGPCDRCGSTPAARAWGGCPDCRDGRRIVPLYRECHECDGHGLVTIVVDIGTVRHIDMSDCTQCDHGQVLVGRGSVEVVPVVDGDNDVEFERGWITVYDDGEVELWIPQDIPDARFTTLELTLDPLPVPRRDFGIVIDCVELAS